MVLLHKNEGVREPCTAAMLSVETLRMNVELIAACVRLFVVVRLFWKENRLFVVVRVLCVLCYVVLCFQPHTSDPPTPTVESLTQSSDACEKSDAREMDGFK